MSEDIDQEFYEVARKHYKSEDERLSKIANNSEFMIAFAETLGSTIDRLFQRDIKFAVFDIDNIKKTLFCGLTVCCKKKKNKNKIITDELRNNVASEITNKLGYKVVWEL